MLFHLCLIQVYKVKAEEQEKVEKVKLYQILALYKMNFRHK